MTQLTFGEMILVSSCTTFIACLIFLICCCYRCLLLCQDRPAWGASATTSSNDHRLDPQVLSSLPIFVYSSMAHEENLECAVCLTEFKEGDKGRLLPGCYHSFHAECADMWLNSHSTCPLCRATVVSETPG
ncbi:putative RING-H2 finger protein ATL64-like [Cocos nucifera]|uniref:RING-type E3 ubiquitin transferase n=1 Tax=Cocos nucifera TaxID=13894 RepID=A0A8K0N0I4_COCNU|nr:putative RING-H2 finger protein ATL64-like [Cocos nucifera]